MLGRLLNTLRYRLSRELRDWRKANSTLRENAWPWYQRVLILAGNRPVRYPLELFSVVIVLSAAIWGFHALSTLFSVAAAPPAPDVGSRFYTLWTVQAAVAAMIYPIVIGFVSLLLQRRHSAKASLHIYLHDSAAILTGLSALFLVAAMAIQFFFLSLAGDAVLANWLILDGIWFLFNILGVIWFLARTFDYLRPERRADIMRAYAINHVWPAEMCRNLEYNLFLGAIHYGWLPGPIYGDDNKESNTAILPGPVGRGMGSIQVAGKYKDSRMIRDVRFRALSLAMRSWQRREEKKAASADDQPELFSGLRHSRLLILPLVPGDLFEEKVGLCRTEGGGGLRWWERWLTRWSFVLVPDTGKAASLSIGDILNGLITEVQVAMESGEEVVFRDALHELVDLHVALLLAGDFISDTGQRDNYANLVDRGHMFESRMHDLWAREYRRLYEGAVDRLSVSDTYFDYMAHMTGWLISRLGEVRPVGISSNLLRLPRYLHYRLNRWWSRTGEEQGLLDHGPCNPGTLNVPAFTAYESAIKAFVGAWESLKNDRFPPTRDEPLEWSGYGEITELYSEHLDGTLTMLFDSLSLGNKEGAEWLCDSLMKWWNTIHFRFDNSYYYIRDERKLTLELLRKPWDEAKGVIDLSLAGNNETRAPKALWAACVHNYWIDLRCVSVYSMLQLGKDCDCGESLPAQLAVALGQGKALRAGGSGIGEQWPVRTLEDLLIAIIRQYYFDGGYHRGYRARLDKVVEAISSQGKPAMVPGRIYSGWGMEDLDALRDGQLLLLCLLARERGSPTAQLMEKIQKWGADDDAGLRAFVDQLKQWKTRLAEAEFLAYESLYSCIQAQFGAINKMQDAITALSARIDQIVEGIDGFRTDQLKTTQISEDRRNQVARWCSQSGFVKASADIPVSLFREVQHSAEEYAEHSLIIREMNKGEFVEPPMAQRASNEDEWFDRTVSSHVAGSVMAEVLKTIGCETVDVDGPVVYWRQIKSAAARIRKNGETPILFVAGRAEPSWLLDWTRSTYDERVERPEGLQLVRDKQFELDGYVGSLNDIPVFVAPIGPGSSYLISQESLNILAFTEFEDDVYIKVSFEPVEGKDALINLRLSWRFQPDLETSECWRFRYVEPQQPMKTV
ncbi:MAG: hypothetical protein AB2692_20670 [Candidatus Thiodiazotropha sp.]